MQTNFSCFGLMQRQYGALKLLAAMLATTLATMFAVFFAPPSHAAETLSNSQLQQQVFAAERAFARSMAERKFDQFALYVADEAIFYGSKDIWRGKEQVLKAWKGFFDEAKAPFSWEPEVVEVLASGTLAHSSGPVKNDKGETFLYYNSIWRLEAPGVWKVVFDKGSPVPAARAK